MRESAGIRRIKRKCESIRFSILSLSLFYRPFLDPFVNTYWKPAVIRIAYYLPRIDSRPSNNLDNTDIFDIETDRSRASISYRFARLCDLSSLPATSRLLTLELANLSRQPGERKWRVIRVKFKLCRVIFGITPLEGTDARNKLETYTFLLNEGFFL